ncbi:MAG TPA: SpoVR family protein [Planctomycetota bacterium]|nr:SpoVR family protein [Planctomycetota bacterium]
MNLTPELDDLKEEIKAHAIDCGLDFFDVVYEVLTHDQMNQIAAMGGFPTRYPHWRFGMEYERLSKSYTYGLSKIYEMVINNDPCYAYLMQSNPIGDQKLVMAHVYAHSDFFKNNCYFAHTSRKAIDEMANHGARIRGYAERYGHDTVEAFLDCCLSIENMIDIHSTYIRRQEEVKAASQLTEEDDDTLKVERIRSKDYMDRFVNPKEFLEAKRRELEDERKKKKRIPEEPTRDLLKFLIEYAPLEKWQRDILTIVREEAYYFAPQGMTKIMNEGWATYWHSRMMTEKLATDREIIDYADHHSGTVAMGPGQINPYKIGVELYRNIEERWNKGQHGPEWDRCDDFDKRRNWDTKANAGREKIFEVRRVHNDVTFIDAFFTKEFCEEHKLFAFKFNRKSGVYEISSREFQDIKRQLLSNLTNAGQPFIYVVDANHSNRGELYLRHRFEGVELKMDHARDTLQNIAAVWSRPVHIETVIGGKGRLLTYDGSEHRDSEISVDLEDSYEMAESL